MPKLKQLVRLFVAVEIADKSAYQIDKLIAQLAATGADVKWVESGLFHITLKFLGDVDQTEIVSVCREIQKAVAKTDPFEIRALGAGAFPKIELPRTIWLGIDKGQEEITALFNAVEQASIKMGFVRENKPFVPHITLGRIRKPNAALKDLSEKIADFPRYDAGKSFISKVVVMASELTKRGPVYSVLAVCPLNGVAKEIE